MDPIAALFWFAILSAVYVVVQGMASNMTRGPRWGAGARDEPRDGGVYCGRAERALRNQVEAGLMFAPLAAAHLPLMTADTSFELGAIIFLAARAAYLPLYVFGVPWVRSLAWFVGVAGLGMIAWPLIPLAL